MISKSSQIVYSLNIAHSYKITLALNSKIPYPTILNDKLYYLKIPSPSIPYQNRNRLIYVL